VSHGWQAMSLSSQSAYFSLSRVEGQNDYERKPRALNETQSRPGTRIRNADLRLHGAGSVGKAQNAKITDQSVAPKPIRQ
jgi:hypothetical protein